MTMQAFVVTYFYLNWFVVILLAYSNRTGDTLWYLHMCLRYILVEFTPSVVLPLPPPPLLTAILIGFILLFPYMDKKYIHRKYPSSSFSSCADTLPVVPTLEKIYFTLLSFIFFKLSIYWNSKEFLLGTSGLYISCFYQSNALPHYLLILYHHAPLTLNSLLYSALYYVQV
jgi:hypothetical protein